jgi:hypothetical protein
MTESDALQVKELYRQVLSPEVAKMMCDKLDNLVKQSQKDSGAHSSCTKY